MMLQMHELLSYLNQQGIVTILVLAQHGMVGQMASPVDLTYLSDAVIMLRFFESGGKLRRALSVLKKRTGEHEETIREYRISARGVSVGPALTEFQGVLTGVPTYIGSEAGLLDETAEHAR
jgi:circadian clock protein KaiC